MTYKILQLKDIENCPYAFVSYKFAQSHGFSLDDYKVIYEDDNIVGITTEEILENLYTVFNLNIPTDFEGHSLSVSDIIKLQDKYYYVDIIGFKEIC
jgi:hypothetical protein